VLVLVLKVVLSLALILIGLFARVLMLLLMLLVLLMLVRRRVWDERGGAGTRGAAKGRRTGCMADRAIAVAGEGF
jgi:hypothetical protein